MIQIKKTLSIAGIIALVTMPVMADIASTAYVQSIVNNIPKPAAATASSAGLTKLYTGVGTNTDGAMTQAAITDALDAKLGNNATDGSIAIGSGTTATGSVGDDDVFYGSLAIGNGTKASGIAAIALGGSDDYGSAPIATGHSAIAIGSATSATEKYAIAIGPETDASGRGAIVIGGTTTASGRFALAVGYGAWADAQDSIAIGAGAGVTSGEKAIQLGEGINNVPRTFNVGFGWNNTTKKDDNYTLLDANGKIPVERLTGVDSTSAITSNKVLQFNGTTKQMQWVDAPAPSLESILPSAPNNCKASDGQRCTLVMTWSSSQNKFTYSWEVVKVNQ